VLGQRAQKKSRTNAQLESKRKAISPQAQCTKVAKKRNWLTNTMNGDGISPRRLPSKIPQVIPPGENKSHYGLKIQIITYQMRNPLVHLICTRQVVHPENPSLPAHHMLVVVYKMLAIVKQL
jgi:hypothetical protein